MPTLPDQKYTEIRNKYSQFTEHILDIDEFTKPKVYNGPKAVVQKIINLILLKPGTYPTRPYMGVGLIEKYRYSFTDEKETLQADINNQIQTYLPEFSNVRVELDTSNELEKELIINIVVDKSVYTITLDSDRKTLKWLIYGD